MAKKAPTEISYDELPADIIRRILLKLTVKPLMVCRCVSTEWLHIISDRGFRKTHSQQHRAPLTRNLIVSTAADGLQLLNLDDPAQDRNLHCPFKRPDHKINLLSICNGLVFASDDELNCYIWNPSTGFYGNVPLPLDIRNEAYPQPHSFKYDHYGLGYLSHSDDYKIFVAVTSDLDPDLHGWIHLVYVYSWRSQTWTKIESPFNHWLKRILDRRTDVFVHNNFHWLDDVLEMNATSYEEEEEPLEDGIGWGILAFDLVRHEFRRIELPPNFDYDQPEDEVFFDSYLGVWREQSLYVLRYFSYDIKTAELWFINEYGVNVEWTRFFALNLEWVNMGSLFFEGRYTNLICIDLEQENAVNIILLNPGNYNYFAFQETLLCP